MEASAHRYRAREALRGNWVIAVLVCLVAGILSGGGTGADIEFKFEGGNPIQVSLPEQYQEVFHEILGISLSLLMVVSLVMLVLGLMLGGVMEVGKARYHSNLIFGNEARFEDLFCAFPRFGSAMVMNLARTLLVALGSLVVVPGILLHYGYAMAPYILARDPECEGLEALRRSRTMLKGHKMDLFLLEVSFIGWMLLATFALGIGHLFLTPYTEAARASFFADIEAQYRRTPTVEF